MKIRRFHQAGCGTGVERLTPQDASNLRVEDHGLPAHVAALVILDGAGLNGPDGQLRVGALRREIEGRLHLAPRLRHVLYRPPLGCGPRLWVDDPRFDIDAHVKTRALSPPGDESSVLAACVELNERPLDRSRPLWEVWFLTGLPGSRVGMLIRLHHAIADGVAAVGLLGALFDPTPEAAVSTAPRWVPAAAPSPRFLFVDNLRRRRSILKATAQRWVHPVRRVRRLTAKIGPLGDQLRQGWAPATSLNGPVGTGRRLFLARADLERTRAVAHAYGAKINDVVLAAVAGGAGALLRGRGELEPGLALRTSVPVSLRGSGGEVGGGNQVGVMMVPLPVAEPDPIRRLEAIARVTRERKRAPRAAMAWDPGSPLGQWLVVRLMDHQRLVNLFTSNVAGPPVPMFFAGARIREVFQLGMIQGNVRVSVGMFSYAGRLNFTVLGDAQSCPDLAVFAQGLRGTLRDLGVEEPPAEVGPAQMVEPLVPNRGVA